THRDLRARQAEGLFREDLYHRLAVFPVRLPPLRERPADLVPLARSLLERIGKRLGHSAPRLSEAAEAALARHTWPGNVRELANALERALILAEGAVVEPEHLVLETPARDPARGGTTLADGERRAIEEAL